MAKKLKVNDRVRRIGSAEQAPSGSVGTVKDIRAEVIQTAASAENRERALMVTVLWDNGTQSTFSPESLELEK